MILKFRFVGKSVRAWPMRHARPSAHRRRRRPRTASSSQSASSRRSRGNARAGRSRRLPLAPVAALITMPETPRRNGQIHPAMLAARPMPIHAQSTSAVVVTEPPPRPRTATTRCRAPWSAGGARARALPDARKPPEPARYARGAPRPLQVLDHLALVPSGPFRSEQVVGDTQHRLVSGERVPLVSEQGRARPPRWRGGAATRDAR